MFDQLLKPFNLTYDDLSKDERATLSTWLDALQRNELSLPKIKEYLTAMKDAVENELSQTGIDKKQDTLLKARLRNYLLLEAFLTSPEKAKKQLDQALMGIAASKVK